MNGICDSGLTRVVPVSMIELEQNEYHIAKGKSRLFYLTPDTTDFPFACTPSIFTCQKPCCVTGTKVKLPENKAGFVPPMSSSEPEVASLKEKTGLVV